MNLDILAQIFGVFDAISTWLTGAIADVMPMFYESESGLTLIGTLCLTSLGISVVFLLIGLIQKFLRFR